MPYSSYGISDGDIGTTNIDIAYRPNNNGVQVTATGTYAGSPYTINSSFVAIIEFQEVN
jgi:hypothetical protein